MTLRRNEKGTNMKTTKAINWTTVCAAVLATTAGFRAAADQPATAAAPESHFTGTVISVEPQGRVLDAKGFFFSKKFNLGANCAYVMLDNKSGTIADLRPGEKVTVSYQNAQGVLIADRVEQQPMRDEGMVQAVDPVAHTLTLHAPGWNKTFQIPNDCNVVLRGGKAGSVADIQAGDHVTITYETPDNKLSAREIAQTSIEFTGRLTAIDLQERTLKAKALLETKRFNVANDCAIVINGKPDGQLSDLKPDDNLVFSYDEINGVNVVNRIAPVTEAKSGSVASSAPPTSGY